ncbi:MAG: rhodanese-like domain-containing protein [Verrucomicrobia bacterium]|nr:rhodanese-like domain-containing protein [Verrucomicrobiota bacterium]
MAILLLSAGIAGSVAALSISLERPDALREGEIRLADAIMRQPPPLWIDARSEAEYRKEHLPGALLLNPEGWDALVPKALDAWEPDRIAVVYCNAPGAQASREVAARLRDFQLGPVFVLHGGWNAWKQK